MRRDKYCDVTEILLYFAVNKEAGGDSNDAGRNGDKGPNIDLVYCADYAAKKKKAAHGKNGVYTRFEGGINARLLYRLVVTYL
jgi:hypothetical protein